MGWLARKYGLQTNSVTAIQIVTPDARVRVVHAEHEPDLFWALRGGGGNFGVVTAIEFKLYPVEEVYAGALFFPEARAAEVLIDTFAIVPPIALAELHMDPREPVPYLTADMLLGELPPTAIDDLITSIGRASESTLIGIELRQMGGALARGEAGHGARATLEGSFSLFTLGVVPNAAIGARVEAELERVRRAAAPWAIGRYLNFVEHPADARLLPRAHLPSCRPSRRCTTAVT